MWKISLLLLFAVFVLSEPRHGGSSEKNEKASNCKDKTGSVKTTRKTKTVQSNGKKTTTVDYAQDAQSTSSDCNEEESDEDHKKSKEEVREPDEDGGGEETDGEEKSEEESEESSSSSSEEKKGKTRRVDTSRKTTWRSQTSLRSPEGDPTQQAEQSEEKSAEEPGSLN